MKYRFEEYKKSEIQRGHLNLGGSAPDGERIDVTSLYIERGGKPWIGVMGEYHFSRDSRDNWYTELCKMRSGGITVASTYLFWIYHEEIEGEFDFSGDLDIRQFILDAARAGLDVVIRIGPWAHGECRNGGFPDWILKKPYKIRENDPEYMAKARIWYEKIYEQVEGLFYKDGGNIIGIQIENELTDNAEHIAALKKLAQDIGYDAPIWTATGWNSLYGAKIPVDEVMPVFGGYPDAPWEKTLEQLPYSVNYSFSHSRNDGTIGVDLIKDADEDGWHLPYDRYPFATCELGGGLQPTHHRRPLIKPMDIYALSLTKLGSGNNLVGYYMYKGGTNKIGKLSTFNETRATGYSNDYTSRSYDFQAPLSEFGEVRGSYRLLNMLHMFVNDFGGVLAPMEAVMGKNQPAADNLTDLRYTMRTDGRSGFVFVNHYQRLAKLADVENAVIDTGSVVFPSIDVKGDKAFVMPFNMDLGASRLEYATAQPLCRIGDTYFFAAIEGIKPRFKLSGKPEFVAAAGLDVISCDGAKIVVLTPEQAKYARKLDGTVYVGEGCDLFFDGDIRSAAPGSFKYYKWDGTAFFEHARRAPFRQAEISFTECEEPFEPSDRYELEIGGKRALKWYRAEVTSPEGYVEIPFECDAAQLYADGEFEDDNFWLGVPWRVPASLLYGKECYIVTSELRNDFYKEI